VFAPAARVYHRLSATGGGPLASYYCGRNFLLLLAKDVPRPLLRRYWARIAAAQLGRAWRAARAWRGEAARGTLRGMAAGLLLVPRYWRKRRLLEAWQAPELPRIERLPSDPAPGKRERSIVERAARGRASRSSG